MYYLLFKALHIVGFVSWFAGLFYLVRLFVYHAEAFDETPTKRDVLHPQLSVMEKRVYSIICTPAAIVTWLFGLLMIFNKGMDWLQNNWWIQVKLILLLALTYYHWSCGRIAKRLANGEKVMSSNQFRLYNEVPTLFLVLITLLAVFKNELNLSYTLVAMAVFAILLGQGVRYYRKLRQRHKNL